MRAASLPAVGLNCEKQDFAERNSGVDFFSTFETKFE